MTALPVLLRTIAIRKTAQRQQQKRQNPFRFLSTATTATTAIPSVQLAPDRLSLQLSFDSSSTATAATSISAPWLFHQHPRYIHPTSGQHLRPLLQAHQYKLQNARIIQRNHTLHPVAPPPGCFHSIGTVYSNHTAESSSSSSLSEWLLQVDWEGPVQPDTAFYDIQWLKQCHNTNHLDDNSIDKNNNNNTIITNQTQLHTFHYPDVLKQDHVLYQLFQSLLQYGAILLNNTPNTDTACAAIAKRLSGGHLSHGALYGNVFHVQSKPDAHNIAYTNDALPVHQDLAYYESPPGFQFLHCRENSVSQGGDSLLIDALAAAHTFAQMAPDWFEILTKTPATFLKQRPAADMMYRRTHIRVSSQQEIVSVHWSPPFEGPFLSSTTSCPNTTRDYFVARSAFERMLDVLLPRHERYLPMLDATLEQQLVEYAHTYTWQQRLRPQQILVFSNQRLLHGRTAFSIQTGNARHLTGCYTNVDETLQQYRLLRRERLMTQQQQQQKLESLELPVVGHGSSRIL